MNDIASDGRSRRRHVVVPEQFSGASRPSLHWSSQQVHDGMAQMSDSEKRLAREREQCLQINDCSLYSDYDDALLSRDVGLRADPTPGTRDLGFHSDATVPLGGGIGT